MAGGFDPEVFKAQLKEEILVENRLMMKKMMREITMLIKESQPTPPIGLIDLDTKLLVREREEDDATVLAEPIGQRNIGQAKEVEQSDWAKDMTKAMTQNTSDDEVEGHDHSNGLH